MLRTLCVLTACAAATMSPLSLELHYSADQKPLAQAQAMAGLRIGVARFKDLRPRLADELHAASFVAHDGTYHVGMTWNGRTFAPVAEVTQGLLVAQLQGAGLNVRLADAEIDCEDTPSARTVGQRDGFDLVLGGLIREFSFKAGQPTVSLEVTLFDGAGKPLLHAPLSEKQRVDGQATPQMRIDQVLDRSFRPVARQLVVKVADQLSALLASAAQEKAREAEAQAAAQLAAATQPSPAPEAPASAKHHRKHGQ